MTTRPDIADDWLTTAEVATLADVQVASIRTYRARGSIPAPERYVGVVPVWRRDTIERWLATRPRVGQHAPTEGDTT